MSHYMLAAAGRVTMTKLLGRELPRTVIQNEPAPIGAREERSDVGHQHPARSSKSRTGRHPGSPPKPQSIQATLAISREPCPHHQGRGVSRGAPALGGPFGRAEGVAHGWMD